MSKSGAEVFTVMIEPVKHCNLSCRHCYADNRSSGIMTADFLRMVLEKVISFAERNRFEQIHFIWHGSEPLLAGINFYERAMVMLKQRMPAVICRHFIQTNGLLLDDDFCLFFRDMNVAVGISLDGPADLHDQLRVDGNGYGTHAVVMEKIKLLEKHHLPVGFCTVISRLSIGHEYRIYRFFQELGYNFRVNPIIPGWNPHQTEKYLLHPGEYGTFMCNLFDVWIQTQNRRVTVSPLDNYLRSVLNGYSPECQHQLTCSGSHLGIKPDGKAVVCSRFETHVLGDIRTMSVSELMNSAFCRQLQKRSEVLKECRACINFLHCYGGCPHNSIAFGHNSMTKDPFCKDYQMIFSHIRRRLKLLDQPEVE